MIPRTHAGTILRAGTATVTTGGGRTIGQSTVATGVECNLQPRRGSLRSSQAGVVIESGHVGFFPPGTDIRRGDEFRVTSGAYAPDYLKVEDVGVQGDRIGGGEWDIEVGFSEFLP